MSPGLEILEAKRAGIVFCQDVAWTDLMLPTSLFHHYPLFLFLKLSPRSFPEMNTLPFLQILWLHRKTENLDFFDSPNLQVFAGRPFPAAYACFFLTWRSAPFAPSPHVRRWCLMAVDRWEWMTTKILWCGNLEVAWEPVCSRYVGQPFLPLPQPCTKFQKNILIVSWWADQYSQFISLVPGPKLKTVSQVCSHSRESQRAAAVACPCSARSSRFVPSGTSQVSGHLPRIVGCLCCLATYRLVKAACRAIGIRPGWNFTLCGPPHMSILV